MVWVLSNIQSQQLFNIFINIYIPRVHVVAAANNSYSSTWSCLFGSRPVWARGVSTVEYIWSAVIQCFHRHINIPMDSAWFIWYETLSWLCGSCPKSIVCCYGSMNFHFKIFLLFLLFNLSSWSRHSAVCAIEHRRTIIYIIVDANDTLFRYLWPAFKTIMEHCSEVFDQPINDPTSIISMWFGGFIS